MLLQTKLIALVNHLNQISSFAKVMALRQEVQSTFADVHYCDLCVR